MSTGDTSQRVIGPRIVRQVEAAVRVPNGVNRFLTIVGWMPEIRIPGSIKPSSYSCLVGPVLQEHEFLGASCLPTIAGLELGSNEFAQCLIESSDADWDDKSGQVEVRLRISADGGPVKLQVLFSLTILVGR